MLHWFRCDNCYSFRDNEFMNGISMEVRDVEEERLDIKPIDRKIAEVWNVASIHGANASGKSNFLRALSNMFSNIAGTGHKLSGQRFLFDEKCKESPIFCEMCFTLPKSEDRKEYIEYRYGYMLNTDRHGNAETISSEWLKAGFSSSGELTYVFEREGNIVDFGEKKDSDFAQQLGIEFNSLNEVDRSKTLLMRLAGKDSVIAEPVVSIFTWCMKVRPIELFVEEEGWWQRSRVAELLCKDQAFKKSLMEYIKRFDTSIVDIDAFPKSGDYFIKTTRNVKNADAQNGRRERSIDEESYGTQKIVGIYQFFWEVLKNGGLLIVDEFDIKLHPWVIRDLVKDFHNQDTPERKDFSGQLIFSAHSLVALNKNYLHMDEIYFTDKDREGISSIRRLIKENLTKAEREAEYLDYGELYLRNRFGAIPAEQLCVLGGTENA